MSSTGFNQYKQKAESTINYFKGELKKIRSGRANPSLIEDIKVDAYDQIQPLKNLGNINVVDAQLLTFQPWDKTIVEPALKAIQKENIGINPVPSGDLIRLPLPPLTEERRLSFVKIMKNIIEDAKKSIRSIRKDILVGLNNEKKKSEITEDELKRYEKNLQDKVNESNSQIEEIAKKKEEELMNI